MWRFLSGLADSTLGAAAPQLAGQRRAWGGGGSRDRGQQLPACRVLRWAKSRARSRGLRRLYLQCCLPAGWVLLPSGSWGPSKSPPLSQWLGSRLRHSLSGDVGPRNLFSAGLRAAGSPAAAGSQVNRWRAWALPWGCVLWRSGGALPVRPDLGAPPSHSPLPAPLNPSSRLRARLGRLLPAWLRSLGSP